MENLSNIDNDAASGVGAAVLASNAKATSASTLQQALTSLIDLRLSVKQAHWTVRDPQFSAFHLFFDSLVEPLDEEIDEIAERIATLGTAPDGTVGYTAQQTQLKAYAADGDRGAAHVAELIDRYTAVAAQTKLAVDSTADNGDVASSDLLTGTLRLLEKQLWQLDAHA